MVPISLVPFDKLKVAPFGRPDPLVTRASAALQILVTAEPLNETFVEFVVQFARLHNCAQAANIGRICSLVLAAIHTIEQFQVQAPPLALPAEPPPTIAEWMLLAAREQIGMPRHLCEVVNAIFRRLMLEAMGENHASQAEASLLIDYACGALLASVATSDSVAQAGVALGKLVRLTNETHAILDRFAIAPAPNLLRQIAIAAGLSERLSLACALACKPLPDKLPLVCLLGDQRMVSRIVEAADAWAGEARNAFVGACGEVVAAFVETIRANLIQRVMGIRLFGFTTAIPSMSAQCDRATTLARSAISSDLYQRSAWEVQRWGAWCEKPRIGKFFPVGLCTLALFRAGEDVADFMTQMILDTKRPDGWRYYDDWLGIPPDTDDIGLALRLAAQLAPREDLPLRIFAPPLEKVRRAIGDTGVVPVWLSEDLEEPLSVDAPNWLGPRCIAVAAHFLTGVLDAGIDWSDEEIDLAIAWVVRTWETEGDTAIFHYFLPYGRLLVARLLHAAEQSARVLHASIRLRQLVEATEDNIRQTQQIDGGWGTPLTTACHLSVLAIGSRQFDPWPSIVYLVSRQRHDGLWPDEPLYRCPGKDGSESAHGSPTLTAAVCLDAFVDVNRFVRSAD